MSFHAEPVKPFLNFGPIQPEMSLNLRPPFRQYTCLSGKIRPLRHRRADLMDDGLGSSPFHQGAFGTSLEIRQRETVMLAVHGHLMTGRPFPSRVVAVDHVESRREGPS